MRLTWLGHATVLLETGGVRLLTDAVLRPRVAYLRREVAPARPPGRVDALLLSHLHHDHLDLPSLRTVPADTVIGPPGTARVLRRRSTAVTETAAGDEHVVGGVWVRVVPAVHDGRRWPLSPSAMARAVGFVVDDGRHRVYFAGDTELFDGMGGLGHLDVALVPIWGWGPKLGPGHMDPAQAAQALVLLRPAIAVPIHWGTYLRIGLKRRHAGLLRDPLDVFRAEAARAAPGVRLEVLEPGGTLDLASVQTAI